MKKRTRRERAFFKARRPQKNLWLAAYMFVVMFLSFAVFSLSAQSLSISAAPSMIVLPWSFDGGIIEPLEVTVSYAPAGNGTAIDYFLTVSRGENNSFEPRYMDNGRGGGPKRAELPYMIETPQGETAKDLTTSLTTVNVISASFAAATQTQTATHRFDAFLWDDTFQLEDNFSDRVEMTLYEGEYDNPGAAVEIDQVGVTITATIPQVYEIRLVSPGAPAGTYSGGYDLFLDDLQGGATSSVDILYRTNMRYTLEASSENGGELVSDGGDRIPYSVTISGKTYKMKKTEEFIKSNTPTGFEFVRETLTVEVKASDVTDQPPGYYTDLVTFDIIAR